MIFYYFHCKSTFKEELLEIIQIPGAVKVIQRTKVLSYVISLSVVIFTICILIATHFNTAETTVFNFNDVCFLLLISLPEKLPN